MSILVISFHFYDCYWNVFWKAAPGKNKLVGWRTSMPKISLA